MPSSSPSSTCLSWARADCALKGLHGPRESGGLRSRLPHIPPDWKESAIKKGKQEREGGKAVWSEVANQEAKGGSMQQDALERGCI